MKHSIPAPVEQGSLATPPPAREVFGAQLPVAETFAHLLATAGVDRGLIGPREVSRLWDRHLLNCASLIRWLPETGPVVDLGSGAGLPGIVLAICRPDLEIVLLEPSLRRSDFLSEAVAELGLGRVQVVRARAEDYGGQADGVAEVVVARAVAPLVRLIGWAAPLLRPGGFLLALKGETVTQELVAAAPVLADWGMPSPELFVAGRGTNATHVVRIERGAAGTPVADPGGSSRGRQRRRRQR